MNERSTVDARRARFSTFPEVWAFNSKKRRGEANAMEVAGHGVIDNGILVYDNGYIVDDIMCRWVPGPGDAPKAMMDAVFQRITDAIDGKLDASFELSDIGFAITPVVAEGGVTLEIAPLDAEKAIDGGSASRELVPGVDYYSREQIDEKVAELNAKLAKKLDMAFELDHKNYKITPILTDGGPTLAIDEQP